MEYKEYTDYHCYILYFNNRDDTIYRCLHRVRVRSLLTIVLGASRLRRQRRKVFTPVWGVGVTQLHMTEERTAEGILGRLFYSIRKTKTADDLLHF